MNKYAAYISGFLMICCLFGCGREGSWERAVDQIHLEWELVSNFVGENDEFLAQFILDNQSNQVLTDQGWALFFNMAPRRILETEHADITHLNGDWYKLSPKAGFNLAPGEAVTVSYKGIEGVIKETDAPMGLYFVFYGDNDEETIVPVTNWKVSPFVREEQLSRGHEDHEQPFSSAKRFEENANMERVDEKSLLPIIPTPYYMEKKTGSFGLAAPLEIHHGQGLENEAEYLSEKLAEISGERIAIKEGPGTGAKIRLGLADIELNGKKEEVYALEINDSGINITGSDAAGVFYGVQSLLALLGPDAYMGKGMPFHLPHLEIKDGPRFAFRSLHMDVSRNFQDKETIKRTLDLMSHYKLNHFLFYTTEDEGWRLEIDGLPELTSVGGQRQHVSDVSEAALHPAYGSGPDAYIEGNHGSGFYTKEDFVEILKYAKARHITIIPELNFPGHARAAIKSMEARYQRLMQEGDEEGAEEFRLIDPEDNSEYLSAQAFKDNVVSVARESTYRFYEKVVDEIAKMYEEAGLEMKKIHAGGDEVPEGSWTKSPMAAKLLEELPDIDDPKNLQAYFFRELMKRLEKRGLEVHVWEEMALVKTEEGTYRPSPEFVGKKVIPYIWNNMFDYPDLGYQLANMGYEVVLCNVSNFYFDLAYDNDPEEPGLYWGGFVNTKSAWTFAPFDWFKTTYKTSMGKQINQEEEFKEMVRITPEARKNIIGLEAQLWSETIKGRDMIEYYMLPKMLGYAESAWAAERSWETIPDAKMREAQISAGWNVFANTVALRELPKLARMNGGYAYRIAPPGAKVEDGLLYANTDFPGLEIRYALDGVSPTADAPLYEKPLEIKGEIRLRTFDMSGNGSREVRVSP
ncbi:family 20 glycosylhydrolase [Negadavirga shengliensis]|uniref:beta-N-acetylhexosaminidase n=1 Tax=Negadavirga shengliensis TaxID=1389218 RepID=A0ABV9SYK4_9BACT